jgi:hypothetical protein
VEDAGCGILNLFLSINLNYEPCKTSDEKTHKGYLNVTRQNHAQKSPFDTPSFVHLSHFTNFHSFQPQNNLCQKPQIIFYIFFLQVKIFKKVMNFVMTIQIWN